MKVQDTDMDGFAGTDSRYEGPANVAERHNHAHGCANCSFPIDLGAVGHKHCSIIPKEPATTIEPEDDDSIYTQSYQWVDSPTDRPHCINPLTGVPWPEDQEDYPAIPGNPENIGHHNFYRTNMSDGYLDFLEPREPRSHRNISQHPSHECHAPDTASAHVSSNGQGRQYEHHQGEPIAQSVRKKPATTPERRVNSAQTPGLTFRSLFSVMAVQQRLKTDLMLEIILTTYIAV